MKKKIITLVVITVIFALVIVTSCFIGLVNISTIKDAKETLAIYNECVVREDYKDSKLLSLYKFKDNLDDNGTIITDNLSFHGLVEDESLVKTKNQRGIVNKIKDYINFLDNNTEFTTTYVPVGDKIAISKRKVSNE